VIDPSIRHFLWRQNLLNAGFFMVKYISLGCLFFFTLLILAACGSGVDTKYSTVRLKINLNGDLGGKAIAGAGFTLTLPSNATPEMVNGEVASGVAKPSGTFADSTIAPIVSYIPAAGSTPGKLVIEVTNSVPAGVTAVGEIATVTLQLANGASLAAANFVLNSVPVSVIDTFGYPVPGMTVSVGEVTLL
jgi:hypothetical protein